MIWGWFPLCGCGTWHILRDDIEGGRSKNGAEMGLDGGRGCGGSEKRADCTEDSRGFR